MSKFKEIIEIVAPVYINPKPEGVQARITPTVTCAVVARATGGSGVRTKWVSV